MPANPLVTNALRALLKMRTVMDIPAFLTLKAFVLTTRADTDDDIALLFAIANMLSS